MPWLVKLIGSIGVRRVLIMWLVTNALMRTREIYAAYLKSSDDIIKFCERLVRPPWRALSLRVCKSIIETTSTELLTQNGKSNTLFKCGGRPVSAYRKGREARWTQGCRRGCRDFVLREKINPELSLSALSVCTMPSSPLCITIASFGKGARSGFRKRCISYRRVR